MQSSHLHLLTLLISDLNFAGAPSVALKELEGARDDAKKKAPEYFLVADQYKAATDAALAAQKATFTTLAGGEVWQAEKAATVAKRMRSVADLMSRSQQRAAAIQLLAISLERSALFPLLHDAAKVGNVSLIKAVCDCLNAPEVLAAKPEHLINVDAACAAVDERGRTPLFCAAERGHVGAVSMLHEADGGKQVALPRPGCSPHRRLGHLAYLRRLLPSFAGRRAGRLARAGCAQELGLSRVSTRGARAGLLVVYALAPAATGRG